MKKILNTKKYTLIFSDPDIILYGSVDGKLCVYPDEAEEFVKSFFSKDIISKEYHYEKELLKAKQWLMGILYHERKNSIPEIKELTGYRSTSIIQNSINKFGTPRSAQKGLKLTLQKRYGKSLSKVMSESMKRRWRADKDGSLRDAVSKGLTKYWDEKELHKTSCNRNGVCV